MQSAYIHNYPTVNLTQEPTSKWQQNQPELGGDASAGAAETAGLRFFGGPKGAPSPEESELDPVVERHPMSSLPTWWKVTQPSTETQIVVAFGSFKTHQEASKSGCCLFSVNSTSQPCGCVAERLVTNWHCLEDAGQTHSKSIPFERDPLAMSSTAHGWSLPQIAYVMLKCNWYVLVWFQSIFRSMNSVYFSLVFSIFSSSWWFWIRVISQDLPGLPSWWLVLCGPHLLTDRRLHQNSAGLGSALAASQSSGDTQLRVESGQRVVHVGSTERPRFEPDAAGICLDLLDVFQKTPLSFWNISARTWLLDASLKDI